MGGEGVALAVVVFLFLLYLIPELYKRSKVLNESAIDERYAQQLRMIDIDSPQIFSRTHQQGSISILEHKVKRADEVSSKSGSAQELRVAARQKAKARAQLNTRSRLQARANFFLFVFFLGMLGIWALTRLSNLPTAVAVMSTVFTVCYAGALVKVKSLWQDANERDLRKLKQAEGILQTYQDVRVKRMSQQSVNEKSTVGVEKKVNFVGVNKSTSTITKVADKLVVPATSVTPEKPVRKSEITAHITKPSYTLKTEAQKRVVKPYASAETVVASTPYRPKQIGEMLGESVPEPANSAPSMTGSEELRSDLLGAGSQLDVLLDRRRA